MKAIGKHFSKVAEKSYARHGAAWAGLLSNWQTVVGKPLSDICQPEKISWPGRVSDQNESRSIHQKIGGTLVVKAAYGRALEIQHTSVQIIDRINAYYGYQAITRIKIVQGKISKSELAEKPVLKPLDPATVGQLKTQMSGIRDDQLRQALHNLAKGVLEKRQRAGS